MMKVPEELSERRLEIIAVFERTGSYDKAAEVLNIKWRRVRVVVRGYKTRKINYMTGYKDTGCLDKEYPSCLNCSLEECKYIREESNERIRRTS